MKRVLLSLLCLSLLVFAMTGFAQAGQGRMGGMGDPYGLLSDGSDFLIHPAGIAKGEGITFYGNYRFTYRSVQDWDYSVDVFPAPIASPIFFTNFETSGNEQTHDVLVGAAIPLGPGRMGIFFNYDVMRGDYDGDVQSFPFLGGSYDLSSDFDNFALRLLYGLPVGGFNLGGEVQFAYRQEENETDLMSLVPVGFLVNGFYGSFSNPSDNYLNLFPFMTPYDSSYWEALFKGSLEGTIGPVETALTMRGGFIFAGDNQLEHLSTSGLFIPSTLELDGDVNGWRLGGDLWLGFSLGDGLSLPFLVRIDYQDKSRDGDGIGVPPFPPFSFAYENEETRFELEAGGGVAKEFAGGTRLAGGIYYNYLDAANDFELTAFPVSWFWNRSEYPETTEHRFQVKLAGDFPLADSIALQFGMNFFYGWIKEDYAYNSSNLFGILTEDASLDGSHWGFGASMGTSVALQHLTLEPFVGFGYQQIKLEGDGLTSFFPLGKIEMDKATDEWLIGTGVSVQFDL